jgi:hypothetical protein
MRRRLTFAFALVLLACSTAKEPALSREESRVVTASARVVAIDRESRIVTLEDAAGERATFRADEAVKNLPQVKVGDVVITEAAQSLLVEVRAATPEEKASPNSVVGLAATADPGQKPAGLFTRQARALYTIESIDKPKGGGTLRDSAGKSYFVTARDPAVLDRVKVGDTVVVTLTETLSIRVVDVAREN